MFAFKVLGMLQHLVDGQTYGVNWWLTRIHTLCMLDRIMVILMLVIELRMTNVFNHHL